MTDVNQIRESILRLCDVGTPVIVGIDGRSGSGKTVLTERLRSALAKSVEVAVLHLEDLYPGWDGLAAAPALARDWVVQPFRDGGTARFHRYDWDRACFEDAWTSIPTAHVLLVEGVGALSRALRPWLDVGVWLELPAAQRYRRAMARDGELYRPHWQRWAQQEVAYLATDDPAALENARLTTLFHVAEGDVT